MESEASEFISAANYVDHSSYESVYSSDEEEEDKDLLQIHGPLRMFACYFCGQKPVVIYGGPSSQICLHVMF